LQVCFNAASDRLGGAKIWSRTQVSHQKGAGVSPQMPRLSDAELDGTFRVIAWGLTLHREDGTTQEIKVVYKHDQLEEKIFPAFKRTFEAYKFNQVRWKDLLKAITVGGDIQLTGPKFIDRKSFHAETIPNVFMRRIREFVAELMNIVFNDEANLPFQRQRALAPCNEVAARFMYEPSTAFRKSTVYFHVEDGPEDDTYRVIIEGEGQGKNLGTHLYQFEPSLNWLAYRYPGNGR
jgi:hypothetical protein